MAKKVKSKKSDGMDDEYEIYEDCEPKSSIVALVLVAIFGTLGIHQFYLGNRRKGIMYLIGGILGWVLTIIGWLGFLLSPIFGIITSTIGPIILGLIGILVLLDFVAILLVLIRGSGDKDMYEYELGFVGIEDRCYVPLTDADKEKEPPLFIPKFRT
jgi:TM2 domain-containing membrane protein YozV